VREVLESTQVGEAAAHTIVAPAHTPLPSQASGDVHGSPSLQALPAAIGA
jgi:hypothetical protein